MRNKLKPFLSILAIAFFLLIAYSSNVFLFLDTSTNTKVAIKNCQSRDPVQGTLGITVLVLDTANHPIPNVRGTMYISHQKVKPDTCAFDVVLDIKNQFTTGPDGSASYTGPDWIHDNSEDLFRVEIKVGKLPEGLGYVSPDRKTEVKKYATSNFHFTVNQLPKL